MVSSSKILTVSYGTFSCTLEGFDDSFDTMKAIAEYFRDLAADDRYFGAEPPTPDAEMLARIAEREIARRVEAHENEGRIVLRASEAAGQAATAPAAAAPAPTPQPEPEPKPEPKQIAAAAALASVAHETEALKTVIAEHAEAAEELRAEEEALRAEEAEAAEAAAAEPETALETPPQEQEPLVAVAPAAEDPAITADALVVEEETAVAEETTAEDDEDDADLQAALHDLTAADDTEEEDAFAKYEDADEPNAFADVAFDEDDEHNVAYEEDYAEDDVTEVMITPAPEPEAEADSVAARLRRIRSVVSHTADSYATDDYSEDEHAQDFLKRTAEELDATLAEDDAASAAPAPEETADENDEEDVFADLSARLAQQDDDEEEAPEAAEEPAAETAESSPEPADTEYADLDDDLSEDTLAQLLADAMPAGATAEPAPLPRAVEPAPEPETAEVEAEAEAEAEDAADDDTEPLVLTNEEQIADEPARPLRARVLKMKRSEFEAAIASGQIEEDFDSEEAQADAETYEPGLEPVAASEEPDAFLSPEDEAELQRELAEVEAEMDLGAPAVAEAEDESHDDEADAAIFDAPDAEEPETAYEDEDEIEIEEPAAAAFPSEPETAPEPEPATIDEADDMHPSPRAARLQGADTDSDASRLFDTADTHFDAPDSNKRRNAIQHLRAAVAATKAEKSAGSTLEQETDEEAYRSDLASVVRPRRHRSSAPDEEAPRSRRPMTEQRQAPLKLVAEQRVDTDREPVRPRRVSTQVSGTAGSTPVEEGGFGEFAEQIGATSLPELLEAAAAYMADVEGRQQFSRPMLMGKLKEVEHDSFSREDGLRSFGHLLRQGKLQKVKGGRFSVTEQTEFRAQARHAG